MILVTLPARADVDTSPLQTPGDTNTVTPNVDNQVSTLGGTTFRYDANGNLLSDYACTYTWDVENRLLSIAGSNNGTALTTSFTYDGMGRRIAITTSSGGITGTIHYGWCGQTLCQERTSAEAPTRHYLAEGEYDTTQGGLVYGFDHLGSVRDVIAGSSGHKLSHFDYDPCGNPTATTGSRANRTDFRYAGLFYHQASGLYLGTNRAYDPGVGRWLSRDPIGENGGLNVYAYTHNNQISYTDPSGQVPWNSADAAVGATLGAAIGLGDNLAQQLLRGCWPFDPWSAIYAALAEAIVGGLGGGTKIIATAVIAGSLDGGVIAVGVEFWGGAAMGGPYATARNQADPDTPSRANLNCPCGY